MSMFLLGMFGLGLGYMFASLTSSRPQKDEQVLPPFEVKE